MIAVLDTAAVDALALDNETARARLRALSERVSDLVIPSAVLAEGLFSGHHGHDYHVGRFLTALDVADVDRALGLAAGSLRTEAIGSGADPAPSGVDAIVAAVADALAAHEPVEIITSDAEDIGLLAAFGDHASRVAITRV